MSANVQLLSQQHGLGQFLPGNVYQFAYLHAATSSSFILQCVMWYSSVTLMYTHSVFFMFSYMQIPIFTMCSVPG